MTEDVNAAIRGCRAAGAQEVIVKDSHGNSKTLLADRLEPGAQLITGLGAKVDGMMAGIDRSFQAAILVGYHAMAGTIHGIMEHTISGSVHRMWLNGELAGEIALSALVCGAYGVPIVAISSDAAGCAEAHSLLPGIRSATVKYGLGRYTGRVLHPRDTVKLIEEAAREGLRNAGSMKPWLPELPIEIRIEFNRTEFADSAAKIMEVRRLDGYTLEYLAKSPLEAHQAVRLMISQAGVGATSDA